MSNAPLKDLLDIRNTLEEKRERSNESFLKAASVFFALTPLIDTLNNMGSKNALDLIKFLPIPALMICMSWFFMLLRQKKELTMLDELIFKEKSHTTHTIAHVQNIIIKTNQGSLWDKFTSNRVQELMMPIALFTLNLVFLCMLTLK